MNTEDIELPPLPKASKMYDIPGYDEEELKDYARAAITAALEARLREVLESVANNACCGGCQEAALVASAALKEASDD